MPAIPSRPAWAADFGADEFGYYADMAVNTVVQRFRYCPPGSFWIGSPLDEPGRFADEGPQHRVQLTKGFWLGDTPVTQSFWLEVMGWNPSCFDGADHAVETVKWDDATAMAESIGCTMPTEAQWEYACRAGTQGMTYDDNKLLGDLAWCYVNAGGCTHPVKQKLPNPWGLYDMLGNVHEWCRDSKRQYTASPVDDPCDVGGYRVFRGGSWLSYARFVRAARRRGIDPGVAFDILGFRLLKPVE